MSAPAGELDAFNVHFADGHAVLLSRGANELRERIRAFGTANLADFSFAPVDENSFDDMCLRANAQIFALAGHDNRTNPKLFAGIPQGRNTARLVTWDAGAGPIKLPPSPDVVQVPIDDDDSIRLLFSVVAAGTAPDVFISYSRADSEFVASLNAAFRRFGIKTWIDTTRIQSGDAWKKAIYDGIESARTFLFVITPDSVKSKVCLEEFERAVNDGKRLFTVLRRHTPDGDIPAGLADVQRFSFVEDVDFDQTAEKLRDDILRDADFERWSAAVLRQARGWMDRGRPRDLLLSKAELREASDMLRNRTQRLPAVALEYLAQSRRHLNRRRTLAAVTSFVLLAGAFYLGTTLLSVYLANEANDLRADNPQVSLQFSKLAVQSRRTGNAMRALRASLVASREAAYVGWSLGGAFQNGGSDFVTIGGGQADRRGGLESLIRTWSPRGELRGKLAVPAGAAVAHIDRSGNGGLFMTVAGQTLYGCLLGPAPACSPLDSTRRFLQSAEFSPDGTVAAALREDRWEVWSLPERKLRFSFPASPPRSVVFSPSGAAIYRSSAEGEIEEIDALTGKSQRKWPGMPRTFVLRISPDGTTLIALADAAEPALIDLPTGGRIVLHTGMGAYNARFSRASAHLAIATSLGVMIFSRASAEPIASIPISTGVVGDLDFRPDNGAVLIAIGKNADVYLLDGPRLLTRLVGHELPITSAVFDNTGIHALTSGGSDARVWDLSPERNEVNWISRGVSVLAFSEDGQELAHDDGPLIRVTRVSDGHPLAAVPLKVEDGPVRALTYPASGRLMVVQAGGRITVLSGSAYASRAEEHQIGTVTQACIANRANSIAVLRPDQSIVLLPLSGDKAQLISPPSARPVLALGCSPDARYVAGATWNPDVATIWDTQAPGRFVQTSLGISTTPSLDRSPRYRAFSDFPHNLSIIAMTGFYDRSAALGFKKVKFDHLGGGMLSTPGDFAARVWDPRTGAMTRSFHGRYGANDASWSRDGALVAMAEPSNLGDEAVSIWDANSGDFIAEIPDLHTGAKLVEFSPEGRRLAVADSEGVIHIYTRERFASTAETVELIQRRTSRLLEHHDWPLYWLWR